MELLDYCVSYGGKDSELSFYETSVKASGIEFKFSNLVCAWMISGRKDVSISGSPKFELQPNDVIVVSPDRSAIIDFPESDTIPTKCITIEISKQKVLDILERMNSSLPRLDDFQ